MNYPLVVEVAHPLCYLLGYDDHLQISGDHVIEAIQVMSDDQVTEDLLMITLFM